MRNELEPKMNKVEEMRQLSGFLRALQYISVLNLNDPVCLGEYSSIMKATIKTLTAFIERKNKDYFDIEFLKFE